MFAHNPRLVKKRRAMPSQLPTKRAPSEKRICAYLYAFGIASIVILVSTLSVWILRGVGA
jgi:hypothetical protein